AEMPVVRMQPVHDLAQLVRPLGVVLSLESRLLSAAVEEDGFALARDRRIVLLVEPSILGLVDPVVAARRRGRAPSRGRRGVRARVVVERLGAPDALEEVARARLLAEALGEEARQDPEVARERLAREGVEDVARRGARGHAEASPERALEREERLDL